LPPDGWEGPVNYDEHALRRGGRWLFFTRSGSLVGFGSPWRWLRIGGPLTEIVCDWCGRLAGNQSTETQECTQYPSGAAYCGKCHRQRKTYKIKYFGCLKLDIKILLPADLWKELEVIHGAPTREVVRLGNMAAQKREEASK